MHALHMLSLAGAVAAGTVSVPFNRRFKSLTRVGMSVPGQSVKRDTIDLAAMNNVTSGGYYGEFEVGTPPQKLTFILDTGSSDTWMNSDSVYYCSSSYQQGLYGHCFPQFDTSASSTFETVDSNGFEIGYLDGTVVSGDYIEDTVTIGDAKIKKQQLGLATDSTETTGIMGLGFSANVAATTKYPTVVDNMVSQGIINAAVYSLYLNDIDSDSGHILFGGIDKDKFVGDIKTLPLLPDLLVGGSDITHFNVALDGFKMEGADDLDVPSFKGEAVLDSGSTISLLPPAVVDPIHEFFNVSFVTGTFAPFIDCKWRGDDGKDIAFEFDFDGKTIRNSLYEAIVNPFDDATQEEILNDPYYASDFGGWEGVCMFGLGTTEAFGIDSDEFVLLGATFLRSAYVVYDLENEQLGIAQANLGSTKTDIQEIGGSSKGNVGGNSTGVDPSDANQPNRPSGNGDDNDDNDDNDGDNDNAAGLVVPSIQVATLFALAGALYMM